MSHTKSCSLRAVTLVTILSQTPVLAQDTRSPVPSPLTETVIELCVCEARDVDAMACEVRRVKIGGNDNNSAAAKSAKPISSGIPKPDVCDGRVRVHGD
jgi:hypothetical protein